MCPAVSALAYTCQFNLMPIQASLRNNTSSGMHRVLISGLAFCAVLYGAVAISGACSVWWGAGNEGRGLSPWQGSPVSGGLRGAGAITVVLRSSGCLGQVCACHCFSLRPTHQPRFPPLPSHPSPAGYTLFGSHTEGDVLKNLTSHFVATLVPPVLARAIVYGVALSCECLPTCWVGVGGVACGVAWTAAAAGWWQCCVGCLRV